MNKCFILCKQQAAGFGGKSDLQLYLSAVDLICNNDPDEVGPYSSAHMWKQAVCPIAGKAGHCWYKAFT